MDIHTYIHTYIHTHNIYPYTNLDILTKACIYTHKHIYVTPTHIHTHIYTLEPTHICINLPKYVLPDKKKTYNVSL